jgi:hypothetical protein
VPNELKWGIVTETGSRPRWSSAAGLGTVTRIVLLDEDEEDWTGADEEEDDDLDELDDLDDDDEDEDDDDDWDDDDWDDDLDEDEEEL